MKQTPADTEDKSTVLVSVVHYYNKTLETINIKKEDRLKVLEASVDGQLDPLLLGLGQGQLIITGSHGRGSHSLHCNQEAKKEEEEELGSQYSLKGPTSNDLTSPHLSPASYRICSQQLHKLVPKPLTYES